MFVVYPPGFDPKKKYPLVHLVHGGPVGTFGDGFSFRWNPQAFAAPGYVVPMVNFHGSSSFGQKWVESILGAHPDKPFTDVMKATDFLIAKGWVDEKRLAAAGGSYGGFPGTDRGHTDRFKRSSRTPACTPPRAIRRPTRTTADHSYGGYPHTNVENIERWSPTVSQETSTRRCSFSRRARLRVPLTQGLELYAP